MEDVVDTVETGAGGSVETVETGAGGSIDEIELSDGALRRMFNRFPFGMGIYDLDSLTKIYRLPDSIFGYIREYQEQLNGYLVEKNILYVQIRNIILSIPMRRIDQCNSRFITGILGHDYPNGGYYFWDDSITDSQQVLKASLSLVIGEDCSVSHYLSGYAITANEKVELIAKTLIRLEVEIDDSIKGKLCDYSSYTLNDFDFFFSKWTRTEEVKVRDMSLIRKVFNRDEIDDDIHHQFYDGMKFLFEEYFYRKIQTFRGLKRTKDGSYDLRTKGRDIYLSLDTTLKRRHIKKSGKGNVYLNRDFFYFFEVNTQVFADCFIDIITRSGYDTEVDIRARDGYSRMTTDQIVINIKIM